jgi:glutathione S-transferase
MADLRLVIGNKNYSSWSMRPWLLLRQSGVPFDEIQLWFDQDARAQGAERYSPTRLVPVLMIGEQAVWDSLAICETVAERFPEKGLWPAEDTARCLARSACAEMHAGFRELRGAMPMNIRAAHPGKGMNAAVRKDIDRVLAIWTLCRERFGREGAMLFGNFSVADAFYAPVVMRFATYAVELPPEAQTYADAVRDLRAVREWVEAARRETAFVAADEPYGDA